MTDLKLTPSHTGLLDQVAQSADNAIKATQHGANDAVNSLTNGILEIRKQAEPMINRASGQASALMQNGMDSVRHTSQQLTDSARRARDGTVDYVKEEPVKAMLIAAATGAALMALAGMLSRSHRNQ